MRYRRRLAALAVCSVVAAGCGTRLDDSAFEVATDGALSPVPVAPSDDPGSPDPDPTPGDAVDGPGDEAPGSPATAPGDGPVAEEPEPEPDAPTAPNRASDVGVTEDTIVLGNITAETGALGDTFAPAVRGLRAWVAATNAAGGIHGRRVVLETCDDSEARNKSLQCAQRLVEDKNVFALVATNTRALGGASQYLADRGVPVLGFPIHNGFYRYPNMFSVYGTGLPRDGTAVGLDGKLVTSTGQFRWYRDNLGIEKASVFSYDVAESQQAGRAFKAGLEAVGIDVMVHTVSFASANFDAEVAKMKNFGTQLVIDSLDPTANQQLCDSMHSRGFEPRAKVSTVVVMGAGAASAYSESCRDVLYVATESYPYPSEVAEVVEFRQAYATYQPGLPLHQWALEAWAMGNIARAAIESMGPAPTRHGFVDYLNSMEPTTAGGILTPLSYRPGGYTYDAGKGRDCFGIAHLENAEWVLADSFPICYDDAPYVFTTALEDGN